MQKIFKRSFPSYIIITGQLSFIPAFNYKSKETIDKRKNQTRIINPDHQIEGQKTNCLIIHPVLYPNKGPELELNLAEEAVGLVKSLDWMVVKGPFWNDKKQNENLQNNDKILEKNKFLDEDQPTKGRMKSLTESYRKQAQEVGYELAQDIQLKDGDYVYSPAFSGTYYVLQYQQFFEQGGVMADLSTQSENEQDLQDEWQDKLERYSLAKSSLVKVKKIKQKYYFTKGKIYELGIFIKQNNIDAIFINTELNSLQTRNLERLWNDILIGIIDENYFRSAKSNFNIPSESETEVEDIEVVMNRNDNNKIKVFDRFTIILQIFAKRAQSRLAKLQLQQSFYQFLKTKLMRDGGNTFSSYYNIFRGDLMNAEEIKLEVVSAKQKSQGGKLSGEGETQLEIQRRIIKEKLAITSKEIVENKSINTIALIGYTNAGKSALMNCFVKPHQKVPSHDMLFQTLNTTATSIQLSLEQNAILYDTIGFISNLPHELVDSFKSTLSEVQNADIVLHIRDISHPQTQEQYKTVMKVLKDLNFNQQFYTDKMIEVWNKIDLLKNTIDYEQNGQPCNSNKCFVQNEYRQIIEDYIVKNQYSKGQIAIGIYAQNGKTLGNCEMVERNLTDIEYNDPNKKFANGSVTIRIRLDDVTKRRFEVRFGFSQKLERQGLLPPKEWLRGSQKYFDIKKKEKQDE